MSNKNALVEKIVLKRTDFGPIVFFIKESTSKEFLLTNAISVFSCNLFLRGLGTGVEIKFENFKQYSNLLKLIANKLNIQYSFQE